MDPDELHVALPKLYGAPAYARPPRPIETIDRPPDLDDLPLEVYRDPEEAAVAAALPSGSSPSAGARGSGASGGSASDGGPALQARTFSVRGLGRFLQGR